MKFLNLIQNKMLKRYIHYPVYDHSPSTMRKYYTIRFMQFMTPILLLTGIICNNTKIDDNNNPKLSTKDKM